MNERDNPPKYIKASISSFAGEKKRSVKNDTDPEK